MKGRIKLSLAAEHDPLTQGKKELDAGSRSRFDVVSFSISEGIYLWCWVWTFESSVALAYVALDVSILGTSTDLISERRAALGARRVP